MLTPGGQCDFAAGADRICEGEAAAPVEVDHAEAVWADLKRERALHMPSLRMASQTAPGGRRRSLVASSAPGASSNIVICTASRRAQSEVTRETFHALADRPD
ncbi:MAG TPA: hypothetical protein VK638_10100 [Edaphobacter sp.]|nr:hypothetical protein [Edaphobacter sp.]